YHKWAKKEGFHSALPGDREKQKEKEASDTLNSQPTFDNHLRDMPPKERIIPYSHEAFRQAAIEWLVATNQVGLDQSFLPSLISILTPSMSWTTQDGVHIPGRKSTREEIIEPFKRRMEQLKAKLNVSVQCVWIV
ncbi:hypothetical protein DFH08DRAFT_644954, partial [Mycena albidolilacea]